MNTAVCTAFAGGRLIATGAPAMVAHAVKAAHDAGEAVLVFDDADGRPVEFDLRGDLEAVLGRLAPSAPVEKRGPGRPKLGVTAREVTLLPRHWDWLAAQPGGASVALRKLVENALRGAEGPDRVRASREAAYRFMTAMAGDQPGYEEATRMLFAGDWTAFGAAIQSWPVDVRNYAARLAEGGWNNGRGS
ncbi:hypothetical protein HNP32_003144 [Brevundimonas bullata]|uniref:DUF2239 family protein n=1 Tax=Brevundimonas bullata TaxID=13160 RepID=A0A7W7IRT8_9CAUL|nr:DUF2239 family protein [Brevundimonas bullata]MBB4799386.1 hypothetical protein [Brevundimonas bullata]MBB6384542.1 hypothetical protein [Brevundimonas bullata]